MPGRITLASRLLIPIHLRSGVGSTGEADARGQSNFHTRVLSIPSEGCSTLLDGLTGPALQHRVREVKRLLRNGIRESGNL